MNITQEITAARFKRFIPESADYADTHLLSDWVEGTEAEMECLYHVSRERVQNEPASWGESRGAFDGVEATMYGARITYENGDVEFVTRAAVALIIGKEYVDGLEEQASEDAR